MHRDIAEQVAASIKRDVTLEDARAIIGKFLEQLTRCPACDGTGGFTYPFDARVLLDEPGSPTAGKKHVPAGTSADCPLCGGKESPSGAHDPNYVSWVCESGDRSDDCHRLSRQSEQRDDHAKCGYRIVLELLPSSDEAEP